MLNRSRRPARALAVVAMVPMLLAAAACGDSGGKANQATPPKKSALIAAYDDCSSDFTKSIEKGSFGDDATVDNYMLLGDDKKSVQVKSPSSGTLQDLLAFTTINCFVNKLHGPSSIEPKLEATNGLAGSQSDTWGKYKITWSYNGSSGFNSVIEET